MRSRVLVITLAVLLVTVWTSSPASGQPRAIGQPATPATAVPPAPPAQPADGPGGSATIYAGTAAQTVGTDETGATVFLPTDDDGGVVSDEALPLIVFLHGFSALDPAAYGAWIEHLVRRGAVVIYPAWQAADSPVGVGDTYLPNTWAGVRSAVEWLADRYPGAVDPDRTAVIGHSAGGLLAAQYAVSAGSEGLPVPTVLMSMMPGGCSPCGSVAAALEMPVALDGDLDPSTLALLINAEGDPVVGLGTSLRVWAELGQLPEDQRGQLTMVTDDHGSPALVAEHNTPQTDGPGQPDAYDTNGLWRLLDALLSCRFDGTSCDAALSGGPERTAVGDWSDGTPVVAFKVPGG